MAQRAQRVDWFRVLTDLKAQGYSIYQVAEVTGIPRTTLLGYKDLGAEPKHSDGESLLAMWERAMVPHVPTRSEPRRRNGRDSDRPGERQSTAS